MQGTGCECFVCPVYAAAVRMHDDRPILWKDKLRLRRHRRSVGLSLSQSFWVLDLWSSVLFILPFKPLLDHEGK